MQRGELRELTGTGARAEVEERARGRKAETRIMVLMLNYNEKQSRGEKELSVERGCWGCLVEQGAGSCLSPSFQLAGWVLPG